MDTAAMVIKPIMETADIILTKLNPDTKDIVFLKIIDITVIMDNINTMPSWTPRT
jgi:hypothetical protein